MRHNVTQQDEDFDDLPIAKWLNNKQIYNAEMDKNENMSIASNLNAYSTSTTITISTDDTESNEFDPDLYNLESIQQLSISLHFWSTNTMKSHFVKWKNHTLNKLNVLHIKYRNYQYVRHKKILLEYFKKWKIVQQHYKSTIISLSHWAHYLQSNYLNAWKTYTFETAPKSRIILCNRIKRDLLYWRHRTRSNYTLTKGNNITTTKHKTFQLKKAWIKWILLYQYHAQILQIEHNIIRNNRRKRIANIFKIWCKLLDRCRKLKQLKFRMICKQFYKWWHLQSSLSIHYKHVYHKNYHSLDQSSRNAFAYFYTKRVHKTFKRWKKKQVYIESLRSKSFQCKKSHKDYTLKLYYNQWKTLHFIRNIIENITIKYYVREWKQYKNRQNIQRQNNLQSQILYARNALVKYYTFWKKATQLQIHERCAEEKAATFYKLKISSKQIQIVFGRWYLIIMQQKDTKLKIEAQHKHNVLKQYVYEWMLQFEYKQMINMFQSKWNKTKHFELYLKVFISWKKDCKYQIALLVKKKEIERNRRQYIFHAWYLTVYKRHKLTQCQVIAKQCSINSAFIRWKVTMKHHLKRKRNEIYLRDKHQNSQMIQTLKFWRGYIQHKQHIKCHKQQLNKICNVFVLSKCYKIWHHSYALLVRFKYAKQQHIHHSLRDNFRYWLRYNRHRQKHQYMLQVAVEQHHKTILINAVLYWRQFKRHRITIGIQQKAAKQLLQRKFIAYWKYETMCRLSLKSRIDNFRTNIDSKRKIETVKWWKKYHLKRQKLFVIKGKIETKREIQIISILFYSWFDKAEETKTLRLLNDHAIGLHKDKVLTRVFVSWVHILPLLKREKRQLMKPQLAFNFYQWRSWSANNNNLRDKCYAIQLRKQLRYFCVYRDYVHDNKQLRKEAYFILKTVHNASKKRIGLDLWRDILIKCKLNQQKYLIVKQKQDANKQRVIVNEWKLLYQVSIFEKSKRLNDCYKTWRKQFAYVQKEAQITHNIYYNGIKKCAFNEWKHLLQIILNQKKSLALMVQNTNTKQKRYFFEIWCMCFKLRQLYIKSNRSNIKLRIQFWRNYATNRIKARRNLSEMKDTLFDKWEFYPSSIYQASYFDDEANNKITLSPLKSISISLAPILAKRDELNTLKPFYKSRSLRPTTPTLLSLSKRSNNKNYNQSKDDLFLFDDDKRIQISSFNKLTNDTIDYDCTNPTKKQIMRHIILKWKYLDIFKAFKQWKNMMQITKEENRLMQYAQYEFRQKSLKSVVCLWKHSANVNKAYKTLSDCNKMKQMRASFMTWHSVYKYCVLSKMHDKYAMAHYKKNSRMKCISYWYDVIQRQKKYVRVFSAISSNKPIHAMRNIWNKWRKLFLFVNQIRNDNDCADIYYYKLLIRHSFRIWHRSFVTKSVIISLIDNTFIVHQNNTKRRILTLWLHSIRQQTILKEKQFHAMVYCEFKQQQRAFKTWFMWHQQLNMKSNLALEIYAQNTLKYFFTNWKLEWLERFREFKINESVLFYQAMKVENQRHEAILFWKYVTQSKKELAVKELTFYHSHLVPNLFIVWKKYTQNKRMSIKYYYYTTLQKYMKNWKVFNKHRQRIYINIDKNFNHMKMQRTKYHLYGWKAFASKCAQIHKNATILIQKRDGIPLLSSNNLSCISFYTKPRFKILHNEPKLLQNTSFDRWKFFYERNQKMKYFFRLIKLERFVAEWRQHTALQNRNKYLMSKVPIIAKNTAMKKHFHLWTKTFKQHRRLRNIFYIIFKRQQFNLMKNTFISIRDHIYTEKRKRFILNRLILCKYVDFWCNRSMKQKEYHQKKCILSQKYRHKIQMQRFQEWKDVFRYNLVSFHLHHFQLSFSRSFYVQRWRNINRKHKIKLFRDYQLRQRKKQYIDEWKGFIITKHKISEMKHIAIDRYSSNIYNHVWNLWNQHLLRKYILIESQSILITFHIKHILQKWRTYTESKQICRAANIALRDYRIKHKLIRFFYEWKNYCIAEQHYKMSLLNTAFGEWISMHMDIKYKQYQQHAMKQIWFIWQHFTQNSIQYNQNCVNEIQSKKLLNCFRIWIQTMHLKQYLLAIYMDASKYYINNLLQKGMIAFKEHRNKQKLHKYHYEIALDFNEVKLQQNAFNIMLYQWYCVKKAAMFKVEYELKQKQICVDIWCHVFIQIKKEQKRLEIGRLYWRKNKLEIVINKWLLISQRSKQNKRYLMHADRKYSRKVVKSIFIFWYQSFRNISHKKQKLFQLQLSWNKRKRNDIFISWKNTLNANQHYKQHKKYQAMFAWKLLFNYHIAAQHERDKNIHLCLNVFRKWDKFTLRIKQKQIKLDELLEVFIDWRKEKLLLEWKDIYYKHCKATELLSFNLQRKAFKTYVDCIALIQVENEKEIKSADHYYKHSIIKRWFYYWLTCYECNMKMNAYLDGKCNKYLAQTRNKSLRLLFHEWLVIFQRQVNDKTSIQISSNYRNHYVLSKIFVEWKLCVNTKRYKSRLLSKSLSTLRQSALRNSRNSGFGSSHNKTSLSHSYIRLSNASSSMFKSSQFKNYLQKQNEEESDDDDDAYDSVLLQTSNIDSS